MLLQAQTLDSDQILLIKKNSDLYKEKEKIDEAFFLLANHKKEEAYHIAHQLLEKDLDNHSRINSYLLLAGYFNHKSEMDSSLYYIKNTTKYIALIQDDSLKTKFNSLKYDLLALNNLKKGLWRETEKWRLKGIETAQKYNEQYLYYKHTHGLANVYSSLKKYKEAIQLYEECLTYKDDPEIIYGSYINIGILNAYLKDYEASNKYLHIALELSKKENKNEAIAVILMNLATNYEEQNNYDKAIELYNESIVVAEKTENIKLALDIRMAVANLYFTLKNYRDAELVYANCIHDAKEFGYLNLQKNIYDRLKEIFIAQNNYKNAFNFLSKSNAINDSITQLQKDKEINELQIKYQTQQKEKAIKLLQIENTNRSLALKNQHETLENLKLKQELEKKENENKILSFQNASEKKQSEITLLKKNQEIQGAELIREKSTKNIILYSFLILTSLIICLLFVYYQKLQTQNELSKKQEEINTQKISSLIKDQELQIIKAQDKERKRIAQELHDSIGGNLAAIKIKVNNSINEEHKVLSSINAQIDDTYQQVRSLSHNLMNKSFNENNFSDVLEEYVNGIWGSNCIFSAFPRKEIDVLNQKLQIEIFKIMQELITNTIKHAKATAIELHLNLVENELNILFEDNGIGFDPKHSQVGVGFENIKNRLRIFKGTFNVDSRIDRGTLINIEIPILNTIKNEI